MWYVPTYSLKGYILQTLDLNKLQKKKPTFKLGLN